jgi:hypothetical protein
LIQSEIRNQKIKNSFFSDWPDLPLVVVAAVRAHTVRRLRLVALRAQAGRRRGERVVRPALGGAGLRMASFRIRHGNSGRFLIFDF